jgi:N-acetylglutamate synthase-like GNAT family acetyltransferase
LKGREDEAAVLALLGEAQIHRPPEERALRAPLVAAEYSDDAGLELWGLEDENGMLVAVAGVEMEASGGMTLHDLAVTPERRQTGAGRFLVQEVRAKYAGRPIHGYTLAEAAGFYAACGFDVAEDGKVASGAVRYRFETRGA